MLISFTTDIILILDIFRKVDCLTFVFSRYLCIDVPHMLPCLWHNELMNWTLTATPVSSAKIYRVNIMYCIELMMNPRCYIYKINTSTSVSQFLSVCLPVICLNEQCKVVVVQSWDRDPACPVSFVDAVTVAAGPSCAAQTPTRRFLPLVAVASLC